MQNDESPVEFSDEPRELHPSEGDIQFAIGIIMILMVMFIAGFVMLMISMASDIRIP